MSATLEEEKTAEQEAAEEKRRNFEEDLEAVEGSEQVREQTFWYTDDKDQRKELTYYQRPLSYFGKLEFFAVLGRAVDQAMQEGLSFGSLTSIVGGGLTIESFVQAISKLASYAPELLKEVYCISLQVPKEERRFVYMVMEQPADKGGLSDADGVAILDTFIDQNYQALRDFFDLQIKPLVEKVQKKFAPPSSKPSKPTRRRTQKASKNS